MSVAGYGAAASRPADARDALQSHREPDRGAGSAEDQSEYERRVGVQHCRQYSWTDRHKTRLDRTMWRRIDDLERFGAECGHRFFERSLYAGDIGGQLSASPPD